MFKKLDQRYFRFRAEKLALAQRTYPDRAAMLAFSEVMRLTYILVCSGVCAAICWILTVTAIARVGALDWRPPVFAIMAAYATYIAMRVVWALTFGRISKAARQAPER